LLDAQRVVRQTLVSPPAEPDAAAGHRARFGPTATVTLEKTDAGFTVTRSHLDVVANVPGATQAAFDQAAANAKAGCPISRLLKAEITMTATLEA